VGGLTDEQLLKRATHAGRNLRILAALASVGLGIIVAASIVVEDARPFLTVFTMAFLPITVGYWMLATAAQRGSEKSVGIVLVVMLFQIALNVISYGIVAAGERGEAEMSFSGLVLPVLVIVALHSSRKALVELKERGLWDQVFGSAKPVGNLCPIGGSLLVLGFVVMNAGTVYVGFQAGAGKNAEIEQARLFLGMLEKEEQEFLTVMNAPEGLLAEGRLDKAFEKIGALEKRLEAVRAEVAGNKLLLAILATYGNGVKQWGEGLKALRPPSPDPLKAQKELELGDRFRAQAAADFDRRYVEGGDK